MVQYHKPVLLKEVLEILQPRPGNVIVDCNLGTGGHSMALLEACDGEGFLIGLDLDPQMLQLAADRFRSRSFPSSSYALVHADHRDIAQVLGDLGYEHADRILMDLGASSLHFDTPERGFSCGVDGPLDMRYDRTSDKPTAADIVNTWSEDDLTRLFKEKGDERWARKIARNLLKRRAEKPFETTGDLAWEIGGAIPRKAWPPKIHPGTRCFLALRVEVNGEDKSLREGLAAGLEALAPEGRMAVLTFQSHEDRTTKRFFRQASKDLIDENDPMGRISRPALCHDLTRKPLRPSPEEEDENPRSRSTKLRAVKKLSEEETAKREEKWTW